MEDLEKSKQELILSSHITAITGTISWLANASTKDFESVFADEGLYFWDKFHNHYDGKEADFFIYLDYDNKKKLVRAVVADIKRGRF